jgi:Putative gypsy type transposon
MKAATQELKKNPVFYTPSTVTEQQLWYMSHNIGLPQTFDLLAPQLEDVACNPPQGYIAFYVSQITAGLRFPIPQIFQDISVKYQVPLNQFAPNAIRDMVGFALLAKFLNIRPTAELFYAMFTLMHQVEGLYALFPRHPYRKFLLNTPTNTGKWKEQFFFITTSPEWDFSTQWRSTPVVLPPFDVKELSSRAEAQIKKFQEFQYDISTIIHPSLLFQAGLSPIDSPESLNFGICLTLLS